MRTFHLSRPGLQADSASFGRSRTRVIQESSHDVQFTYIRLLAEGRFFNLLLNYFVNMGKILPSMKHIILAAIFAAATLTACSHKPAPAPVDTKCVKTCKKVK